MSNISNIDKNFAVETKIKKGGILFHDSKSEPFKIYGVFYENGCFRRLPENVAKQVNAGVASLHTCAAGGRVRFRTNSPYVAINAKMVNVMKMPHFALTGSCGFDLYVEGKYTGTYIPPFDFSDGYEGVIDLSGDGIKDITINMPLYSGVSELYVGLAEGSEICEPTPYKYEKPILYYGSSITQGGCASRPGTSYQSIVSRALDADFINLGFSGSARAEKEISDYIKGISASVFVYDYDHNAPSIEHLRATHERMFLEIREANPSLPIIIMSRPKYTLTDDELIRLNVIKATYENALKAGDKNVYFIDGRDLMALAKDEGTVDNCHPTDFGFASMAVEVERVLGKIICK